MNKRKIILPLLIVVVAIIVGGGIIFSRKTYQAPEITAEKLDTSKKINIRPITNEDHVYGNPNADVVLITYSDLECPSCQKFHATMQKILEEYAKSGTVAWVYRHFPIEKSHPKAKFAAVATECVASVGGENKFWEYLDKVFEGAPNSLLPENLRTIATEIKIDSAKYDSCIILESDNRVITQSVADGEAIFKIDSNFATPYTILISKNGLQTQLIGNQDLSDVIEIINLMK